MSVKPSSRANLDSPNSSSNSKDQKTFTSLILKNCKELGGSKNVVPLQLLPRLPLVEKRDYVHNWILSSDANPSGKRTRSKNSETKENSRMGAERIAKRSKIVRPESAGKSEDRVICRFVWHVKRSGQRLSGTANDRQNPENRLADFSSSETSPSQFPCGSPLRWNGYEIRESSLSSAIIPETQRVHSCPGSEPKDNFIPDTDSSASSGGVSAKNESGRACKAEPVTPLRWTGYGTSDSSQLLRASQTLSSPIVETDTVVPTSSDDESEDAVILDDCSSVASAERRGSHHPSLKPRSLCRWEGYGLPEALDPPRVSSPTLNESETSSSRSEDHLAKDEAEIETESIATTIGPVIECISTQNPHAIDPAESDKSQVEEKNPEDVETCDSDETHYSGEIPVRCSPVRAMGEKLSSNDRQLSRNRSDLISEASSTSKHSEATEGYVPASRIPRSIGVRKNRAKKGSLVAKLRSLVSLQISSLQIWQYRASRNEFKNLRSQCVKLAIMKRETRYNRHFLLAKVLEDSHHLLRELFPTGEEENARGKATVTLMIVPEINGTPKVGVNSVLEVNPPWVVMDSVERVISVLYYYLIATRSEKSGDVATNDDLVEEKVLETFECPCLRRGVIDESCTVKFTNTKPSFIREIFGPHARSLCG